MTTWPAVCAAALLVVVAAAGCGGGGEKGSPASVPVPAEAKPRPATADERRAITEIVGLYLDGLRELDAKKYCSAFDESQQEFIANSQGAEDCARGQRKAWKAAMGQLGKRRAAGVYRAFAKSEIADVEVTGDDAVVTLDVPPEAGVFANADTISLGREGGRWRIDNQIGRD